MVLAGAKALAVVTAEKASGNPAKPKIPDVCGHRRIPCIEIVDFFRKLRLEAVKVFLSFSKSQRSSSEKTEQVPHRHPAPFCSCAAVAADRAGWVRDDT
jgi:hypothetical protein